VLQQTTLADETAVGLDQVLEADVTLQLAQLHKVGRIGEMGPDLLSATHEQVVHSLAVRVVGVLLRIVIAKALQDELVVQQAVEGL